MNKDKPPSAEGGFIIKLDYLELLADIMSASDQPSKADERALDRRKFELAFLEAARTELGVPDYAPKHNP